MSAFTVSPAHLEAILATWAALGPFAPTDLGFEPGKMNTYATVFAQLAKANADSVGARYRESVEPVTTTRPRLASALPLPPVAALKAIDCFTYQCGDAPGWEESAVNVAMSALYRTIVRKLPGYDAAAWSIA